MRKKFLEKRMQRLTDKMTALKTTLSQTQDVEEARSIVSQMDELKLDIEEIEEEMRAIDLDAAQTSVNPLGAYGVRSLGGTQTEATGFASMEYRSAFRAYVTEGTPIPADVVARAAGDAGTTVAADIGALIPTTVMDEVIRNLKGVYGTIYSKVRKLNVKGGVKFPISSLAATLTWVGDGSAAAKKKAGDADTYVSFGYNLADIRIATSVIASVVSLDAFEKEVAALIAEAYVKAMDIAIIAGTGTNEPLGITVDERVTNVIEMSEEDICNWKHWKTELFAKIPLAKRGQGEFIFPASTVETYLETMSDKEGRPLFKELDSEMGAIAGKFFGRYVQLVEPDIIQDFDTAEVGDIVGVLWVPTDYAVNTNLQFGMTRYFDHDTNEWIDKALTIVDGKMLDTTGCFLIKKKAVGSTDGE